MKETFFNGNVEDIEDAESKVYYMVIKTMSNDGCDQCSALTLEEEAGFSECFS